MKCIAASSLVIRVIIRYHRRVVQWHSASGFEGYEVHQVPQIGHSISLIYFISLLKG